MAIPLVNIYPKNKNKNKNRKSSYLNPHLLQRNKKHRHLTLLSLGSLFSVLENIMILRLKAIWVESPALPSVLWMTLRYLVYPFESYQLTWLKWDFNIYIID